MNDDPEAGEFASTEPGSTEPGPTAFDSHEQPLAAGPHGPLGRIGPYLVLEKLGEGGMGQVFLAEQTEPVKRRVALKVIKPGTDSRQVVARFEAERQALALMDHPAIAKIYEAGTTPHGRPYFVMEYVAGAPITEYCDREQLAIRDRLKLFIRVCEGVQHAHQKALIHRDLKPSNVLVTIQDGKPAPKIIDFGVAKAMAENLAENATLTQLGGMIGTPAYMSPEQALIGSEGIDTRTDVYALGVMLYELLAGALPFETNELQGIDLAALVRKIREEEPARPSARLATNQDRITAAATRRRTDPPTLRRQLSGDLDWITMKALEKDRSRRYGSPSDFAADVQRHLRNEPVLARPPSFAYLVRKFVQRHRVGVAAAAAVVVALVGGLGAALLGMHSAVRAREAESAARKIASESERKATAEAAKSRAALDFIMEMFGAVDPALARGHDVTVAELLDPAAMKVAQAFAGDVDGEIVVRHVLGQAYKHLARYPESLRELERAWELHRSSNVPEDPESLTLLHNLGTAHLAAGNASRARELLQRTREGRSAALGELHRDTLVTRSVLAYATQLDGDLDSAIADIRVVLRDQESVVGPDDRDTLESMCSLADMLGSAGQTDEALRLAHVAAERATATLGVDSGLAVMATSIEAELLQASSQYEQAAGLLRRVVATKERLYGPSHPDTLVSLDLLARALGRLGQPDQAIALRRTVVDRARKTLGETHSSTLTYMNNLAQELRFAGRLEEAERLYRRVIELRRAQGGEHGQDTFVTLSNLGLLVMQRGAPGEALPLLREALEGLRGSLPEGHWMLGVAMLNVGRCHTALKDFVAAETSLSDAHALLEKALGPDHARTLQARTALAQLYEAWGKPDAARRWQPPA